MGVPTSTFECDVAIVGAGSAGVAAAIGASRTGARVILVERYGFAGGAATTSSVLAYCGLFVNTANARRVVGGVATEVLAALEKLGVDTAPIRLRSTGNWIVPLNPEALKVALDRTVTISDIQMFYHATLCGVTVARDMVAAIDICGDFGVARIKARAFIDASGEGNLWHLAGHQRRGSQQPLQPASLPIRVGGVGTGWQKNRDAFRIASEIYNAQDPTIRARSNGGVVLEIPSSSEVWWMALDLDADPTDAVSFGRTEVAARDASWRLVCALRKAGGAFGDAYVALTGPRIGVRESRRPVTVRQIQAEEIVTGAIPDGAIALGGWPMEIHYSPGVQEYIAVGGKGFFGIPMDALRVAGISNLLVAGRLIGADTKAFGSIRVMGTAFATGQAAGVYAAHMVASPDAVRFADVRRSLEAQGAIVDL
ncbi:MAG: FAD-dependent oxidoreductase [Hyphomicrobiales bacterium]|nr:FAD-dependent oxidoreductase [Hyphomicrobiales bacterium]